MPTYDLIVEAHMLNLENLKKQAKLILRWHRERHYPVAAQIRAHLPRFLNMPDSEILAANFKHQRCARNSRERARLRELASPENWTFDHAAQAEIIAIQSKSGDYRRGAATARHQYRKIVRIFREVRLLACIQ